MNKKTDMPGKTLTERYFEQLFYANEMLAEYRWQIRKAAARACSVASASAMENTRVQVSAPAAAAFVRRLEKKDDLCGRLSVRIQFLQSLVDQASGLIGQYTSGREKQVLTLRYLENRKWLQVSKEVDGLSPKQLRRIARKGLARIVLPEDAVWIGPFGRAA